MTLEQQIIETTEVRRHNGQCAYGEWIPLTDAPETVIAAVSEEVGEVMFGDIRQERRPAEGNTDDNGEIVVGGERWLYRR